MVRGGGDQAGEAGEVGACGEVCVCGGCGQGVGRGGEASGMSGQGAVADYEYVQVAVQWGRADEDGVACRGPHSEHLWACVCCHSCQVS